MTRRLLVILLLGLSGLTTAAPFPAQRADWTPEAALPSDLGAQDLDADAIGPDVCPLQGFTAAKLAPDAVSRYCCKICRRGKACGVL